MFANRSIQIPNRTVPGFVDVLGVAAPNATVTVNGQATARKGGYFHAEVMVNNSSAPQFPTLDTTAEFNGATKTETGNQFLPQNPESYWHDGNGNLMQDGRWWYSWDAENRLVEMQTRNDVPDAAKQKLTFAYDAQGRRIRKQVYDWDAVTGSYQLPTETRFIYSGWNLLAELDENNVVIRSYVWGLDVSGSLQGAGGVGGLVAVQDAATLNGQPTTHFAAMDGNGNVAALVNAASGAYTARYEYGPFGEVIRLTGSMAKANPFRFSTKYQDGETDLLYYGYRFYDPSTGRWLSRDPIKERGGLNLYNFDRNNPLSFIDPVGLNLYAIDGTGSDEAAQSNVLKFNARYRDGRARYYRGPGNPTDGKVGGGPFGRGSSGIIDAVVKQICEDYRNNRSVKIDIVGFSRGSAIANEVAWELKKNGCSCRVSGPKRTGYKTENPQVRFLGLYDPVYSFPRIVAWAWHSEQIAGNVDNAAIAYANDEERLLFRHSILSPSSLGTRLNWEDFPGRHSDVGGHVDNNHAIALTSLKWMVDQAVAAGVKMDTSGLPTQNEIIRWKGTPMLAPGSEEAWTGILNENWTINWTVLQTSPWR